jgi:hypothetical protein
MPHFLHAASATQAMAEIIFILHDVTTYIVIALFDQNSSSSFPPMNLENPHSSPPSFYGEHSTKKKKKKKKKKRERERAL